jgi:hypothetical protein
MPEVNPLSNEFQRSPRLQVTSKNVAPEIQQSFLALKLNVNVTGIMFIIKHPDDNAKKD